MGTTSQKASFLISTRDVDVAGHRLHLNETGDLSAPAVLWLHGSGPGVTALTNWQALITRLAPRFHNLAPDILGFADSSHPIRARPGWAPTRLYALRSCLACSMFSVCIGCTWSATRWAR